MMMKKLTVVLTSVLLVMTLAACGQDKATTRKSSADTGAKTSKKVTQHTKQSASRHSTKVTTRNATSSAVKPATQAAMDFNKIKVGNFSGLEGSWAQIGAVYKRNNRFETGGDTQLSVSQSSLTSGARGITLHGNTLTDDAGDHPLKYEVVNNALTLLMKDADAAINWTVTFYPKDTTSIYRDDASASKNTKNLVAIWSSSNSTTMVYAQGAKATQASSSKLDVTQLSANNFSSLVGRWKNPAGKVMTITDQVIDKPEGNSNASEKGVVVSGEDRDGSPEVVVTGSVRDGYILGGIGRFNELSFEPLAIVPSGIKAADNDDSNINQDRLISGGGQAGFASQAYYRE